MRQKQRRKLMICWTDFNSEYSVECSRNFKMMGGLRTGHLWREAGGGLQLHSWLSCLPPANLLTWYRSRVEFSSRPVFALSFSFPTLGLEVALSYNSCCDRYELALPLIPTHKLLTWRTHLQQVRLMFLPAGPTTEQGQQEKGRNLRSTLLSND